MAVNLDRVATTRSRDVMTRQFLVEGQGMDGVLCWSTSQSKFL